MTLQSLDAALKTVCADTYHIAAPAGLTRYVVWAEYGSEGVEGDDSTLLDIPRVQIDAVWQNPADTLPDDVRGVLRAQHIPYEVISVGYDDEWAGMRMILQFEVI